MTISVAIASYNGARHIQAQLDSIAAQTLPPDEVVVADDGSTDDTCGIVTRFGESAPFAVRLIRHERNLGILENFYSAFDACTGGIVYYCDQDDVWLPDKIERVQAAFTAGTALVMHQSEIVDDALVGQGRVEPGNPAYGRLPAPVDVLSVYGYGHQMAFRRDVLTLMRKLKPAVERAAIRDLVNNFDGYIPFCASLLGDIVILPDPLTRFRRHAAATSGAGLAMREGSGWGRLAGRAATVIDQEVHATGTRLALVEACRRDGLLDAGTGRGVERALARQAARAAALNAVATGTRLRRIAALPAAIMAATRATGFSNDRRRRMAAFALATALG